MMQMYYAPEILHSPILSEEESGHIVRVLRMKVDDELLVTDGKGHLYRARILEAHPKRTAVEILTTEKHPSLWGFTIKIAVAPTKNMDRMEWFAEKATEIGIDEIAFIRCAHSERREIKTERIRKIARSAMKQSQKVYLPEIHDMTDFATFVKQSFEGEKYIAHCEEEDKKLLSEVYKKGVNALILIGPEGDFSPEEIALAKANGFVPVSLGESRLRTETAALVACHTPHLLNQLTP